MKNYSKTDFILNDYYNKGDFNFGTLVNTKFSIEQRKAISEYQVFKYIWRFKEKNGVQDLIKASYYLNDLISLYSQKEPEVALNKQKQKNLLIEQEELDQE